MVTIDCGHFQEPHRSCCRQCTLKHGTFLALKVMASFKRLVRTARAKKALEKLKLLPPEILGTPELIAAIARIVPTPVML